MVLKETPTPPRSAQRPAKKYMATINAPGGMLIKQQLVIVATNKKRKKILPRNPSRRKEAVMETLLDMLPMVRPYKLVRK